MTLTVAQDRRERLPVCCTVLLAKKMLRLVVWDSILEIGSRNIPKSIGNLFLTGMSDCPRG
jgi:hypothetical protein